MNLRGMLRSPDPYRRRYALRVLGGGFGYVSTPAGILDKDVIVPQPTPPVPSSPAAATSFAQAVAYAETMFHSTLASAALIPAGDDRALQAYADAASAYFAVYDRVANQGQTDNFALAQAQLYHGDQLLQSALSSFPPPPPSGPYGPGPRTAVPDTGRPWWKSWKVWLGVGGAAAVVGGGVYAIRRHRERSPR